MTDAPYPIETERLRLRLLTPDDAPTLVVLNNDEDVARGTLTCPYPYSLADAERWLADIPEKRWHEGWPTLFGVELRTGGALIGSIGLTVEPPHRRAELGYMFGKPYWNKGYATESSRAMVRYGFDILGLNRVYAGHWGWNAASGRVLEKIGMRREGRLREHYIRFGLVQDSVKYAILRSDYAAALSGASRG